MLKQRKDDDININLYDLCILFIFQDIFKIFLVEELYTYTTIKRLSVDNDRSHIDIYKPNSTNNSLLPVSRPKFE